MTVKRIQWGEVLYKVTEFFQNEQDALVREKPVNKMDFTLVKHKIDRVNITKTEVKKSETDNLQSFETATTKKPTKHRGAKNEQV